MNYLAMRSFAGVVAGIVAGILGAALPVNAVDGTWNYNGSGNWGDTTNWVDSIVADGAGSTATVANVLSADRTVTLDSDRTIGSLYFLDTNNGLTISGTNTLTLADPSGTSVLYSVNNRFWNMKVPITGDIVLTKRGVGLLTLGDATVTNSYTGGTVIDEGRLSITYDYNLGDPAAPITMKGTTLSVGNKVYTSNRPIVLNSGANILLSAGNGNWTCSGPLSGTGGLIIQSQKNGGNRVSLMNLDNTFTGELGLDHSGDRENLYVTLASLADSPGCGNIYFMPNSVKQAYLYWSAAATNGLVLNHRSVEFRNDGDSPLMQLRNDNASYGVTINTDFLVSGSGNKTFEFYANSIAVTNEIAGQISDGASGAIVALKKSGNGALVLSGDNTNSGTNTVTAGTLILEGEKSLADSSALNITGGKVEIKTTERVDALLFLGVDQAKGTWGSSTSGAEYTSPYFVGPGILYVNPPPPAGTMFLFS